MDTLYYIACLLKFRMFVKIVAKTCFKNVGSGWMDGWMVTLVHGSPLSRDSSKATLRPRCHKTLLPVVLFQGNIPSTVAVVYVKDTVQCHRSEPYSTLQYSWCTLFAKGQTLSVSIST